ncbi:ABC transporter ATP-binding protein [Propylenella binzhouense]|uniref:ABC transporter ATP-binding protein n=1 Tax=Propylenella binzhouense TaxID=2555902 RepID=UPI00136E119A|nr:ABC transporter ATP-binding protein [Propylenella binzhouense]
MTSLIVDRLTKRYGSVLAVDGISFSVERDEFISLLGPSGCGKTTTLRCIAGFERPDGGAILLNGEPVADAATGFFRPPNKRHFGMVFQSYAVWPHMTVKENVAYPLKVQGGVPRAEMEARVADKLRIVGLVGYEERFPTQLSGGQQQRVALARALVMEPRALLFDEPLSNLDAKLRERMRFELIEIQSKLGIPAVYVTHDQAEAMVMSRTVIVMEKGRISQSGRPEEVYARPKSRFVADFIGLSNFVEGTVAGPAGDGNWLVRTPLGELVCCSDEPLAPGRAAVLAIRPECIRLQIERPSGPNVVPVTLKQRYFLGPYSEYFVAAGEIPLRVQASDPVEVAPGGTLFAAIDPERCRVLAGEASPEAAQEMAVRATHAADLAFRTPSVGLA